MRGKKMNNFECDNCGDTIKKGKEKLVYINSFFGCKGQVEVCQACYNIILEKDIKNGLYGEET
jgi:hypothetical protein